MHVHYLATLQCTGKLVLFLLLLVPHLILDVNLIIIYICNTLILAIDHQTPPLHAHTQFETIELPLPSDAHTQFTVTASHWTGMVTGME